MYNLIFKNKIMIKYLMNIKMNKFKQKCVIIVDK